MRVSLVRGPHPVELSTRASKGAQTMAFSPKEVVNGPFVGGPLGLQDDPPCNVSEAHATFEVRRFPSTCINASNELSIGIPLLHMGF